MTIKVSIKHESLGYDKDVIVSEETVGLGGALLDREGEFYDHRLKPGQSVVKYVHSTQAVIVMEAPSES